MLVYLYTKQFSDVLKTLKKTLFKGLRAALYPSPSGYATESPSLVIYRLLRASHRGVTTRTQGDTMDRESATGIC